MVTRTQTRLPDTLTARFSMRDKRPMHKRPRWLLPVLCLALLIWSIVPSVIGYFMYAKLNETYHQDTALAYTGAHELETGFSLLQTLIHDPFNRKIASTARQDFQGAFTIFNKLQGDLALIPGVLDSAPTLGTRLSAARHLVPVAQDAAEAGIAGCAAISILTAGLHNPLHRGSGLMPADWTALSRNLERVAASLGQAMELVKQLSPQDLQAVPGASKLIGEFHAQGGIQQVIEQAGTLIPVLPSLLGIGKPSYYLIEVLDSSELRPGGGFIGNYGIITLTGGQVTSAHVIDTYLLDRSFEQRHHIPYPADYKWFPLSSLWGLRDSNLTADFPTSARDGEMLYRQEGGRFPLAGVIAITPALIQQILILTGPVSVPEYHETVTAQNLIARIHYHQLIEEAAGGDVPSADGYSSVRKHFTALLAQDLLARVRSLSGSLFPKLLGFLTASLQSKDLQIYFTSNAAERLLQAYHVDDAIQSPVGDGIFVVDANVTPNKANQYMVTSVDDTVVLDRSGTAIHRTVIQFTWTQAGLTGRDFYGSTRYRGYLRVYVPPGSVLQSQEGWQPRDTGIASGNAFWGGFFFLDYPHTGSITLTWKAEGAAKKYGQSWLYLYSIQRQAGAQENMDLQVSLPPCSTQVHTSTGMVNANRRQVYLAQPLQQNTNVSIGYTCRA